MGEPNTAGTRLSDRVAEELRALLARRQTTPTALAKRMGVSQTYVWRRLTGETAFDLDDLDKIANVLEIETLDLLQAATSGLTLRDPHHAAQLRSAGTRPADNRPGDRPGGAGPRGHAGRTRRTRPPFGAAA